MSDPPENSLEWIVQWWLRDESMAISALEHMPTDFFPPLFTGAFTGRHTNPVRAMVAAWPFHNLSFGTLGTISHMETLKAVLDALDFLLTQKVRPRRWKLQVLDLQRVHKDSWDEQAGGTDVSYSPQVLSQKQTTEQEPECGVQQPLRVLADFDLCGEHLKETDKYLLKWARLRKDSVQLCCRELKIRASPVYTVIEILTILHGDHVQELELNSWWQQGSQAWFAHCLERLKNLCKLPLLRIFQTVFSGNSAPPDMKKCLTEPVPQVPNLNCVQHLYLNGIYSLKDNLGTVLRRWKLRVLDLRNVHKDFWDVWTATQEGASSTGTGSEKQVGKDGPRYALRRRLKVVTDLSLRFHLRQHQTCLLQWARQRRGSVRLCCVKMTVCAFPVKIIKEVLDTFQPDYIEELELFTSQVLPFLGAFASCLGRMRNLRKFCLTRIYLNIDRLVNPLTDTEEKCAVKFLSQFSKLNRLQHLCLDRVYFSSDHLKQLFRVRAGETDVWRAALKAVSWVGQTRCLKTPLESLCITLCQLSQTHLKHLSQCQRLCQLRHLNLSGVELSKLRPTHLRVLLENVADTLENLELMHCRMKDSQLRALLPALSQCSQLTTARLYDNDFSMAVLKDLLQSMANLSKLTVELYPAPLECYDPQGYVLVEKFTQ
ncbi:hypothetical protein STEG23_009078, partial [Scotinomys teguina]